MYSLYDVGRLQILCSRGGRRARPSLRSTADEEFHFATWRPPRPASATTGSRVEDTAAALPVCIPRGVFVAKPAWNSERASRHRRNVWNTPETPSRPRQPFASSAEGTLVLRRRVGPTPIGTGAHDAEGGRRKRICKVFCASPRKAQAIRTLTNDPKRQWRGLFGPPQEYQCTTRALQFVPVKLAEREQTAVGVVLRTKSKGTPLPLARPRRAAVDQGQMTRGAARRKRAIRSPSARASRPAGGRRRQESWSSWS
ncbi:hypothetical protein C2E23DRAFT_271594 [Lenzites betulinus]|nr:hypothetical protein C2E23DRAFT_271490 [Lenzites betulinus]KAH9857392.1 hypothetical protein C2E23DRAFT_271594 [Lenzites betulinus]